VSFGLVGLKAIRAMLDACAPGHEFSQKKHRNWVRWKGRTFRGLPIGDRGKQDPEIQVGKVNKMCRFLAIDMKCAQLHIPVLQ
jgi:hypothetical protein